MKRFEITFKGGNSYELEARGYDDSGSFLRFYRVKEVALVSYDYPGWFARTFLGRPYRVATERTHTSYQYDHFLDVAKSEVRTIRSWPVNG